MNFTSPLVLFACMFCALNTPKNSVGLSIEDYLAAHQASIKIDSSNLFDSARNRKIPILTYQNTSPEIQNHELVILAHGHGGKYSEYSFIGKRLAKDGYFVVSIQYELPTDTLIPVRGSTYESLKPKWERVVNNLFFVIQSLKEKNLNLDFQNLILIGHSMGGDVAMLFAAEYPELVQKVISLDHCHMPILRTNKPGILSLRSNTSVPADPGVLPTQTETTKYNIHIIQLNNVSHGEMTDQGSERKKKIINNYITAFLKDKMK